MLERREKFEDFPVDLVRAGNRLSDFVAQQLSKAASQSVQGHLDRGRCRPELVRNRLLGDVFRAGQQRMQRFVPSDPSRVGILLAQAILDFLQQAECPLPFKRRLRRPRVGWVECLLRLVEIQSQVPDAASTFQCLLAIVLVVQEVLQAVEQECSKTSPGPFRRLQRVSFQQPGEERLREILRVRLAEPAASNIAVQWPPIGLAEFGQCGARRRVFAVSCRTDHCPTRCRERGTIAGVRHRAYRNLDGERSQFRRRGLVAASGGEWPVLAAASDRLRYLPKSRTIGRFPESVPRHKRAIL